MKNLLISLLVNVAALLLVSFLIPGFQVDGIWSAVKAAIMIAIINGTLGLLLKVVTFPLSLLTLGLFWLVINALMLMLASKIVDGFHLSGFLAAFFGAIALSIANTLISSLVAKVKSK
jgi:putative membrane protein